MKKLLLILCVCGFVSLSAATGDWVFISSSIGEAREELREIGFFYDIIASSNAKSGEGIDIGADICDSRYSSVLSEYGRTCDEMKEDPYFKVKISDYNKSFAGVIYKYKIELWTDATYIKYADWLITEDGRKGIIFKQKFEKNSSDVEVNTGFRIYLWDNSLTERFLRKVRLYPSDSEDISSRNYKDCTYIYEGTSEINVYFLEHDSDIADIGILGGVINKTSPFYTTAGEKMTTAASPDYTFGKYGIFSNSSSADYGWVGDGVDDAIITSGYPVISSLQNTEGKAKFGEMYSFIQTITGSVVDKKIEIGSESYTIDDSAPGF